MKSISLSLFLDAVLSCASTILIVLCLGRLLGLSGNLIIPISLIVGICISAIITLNRLNKREKLLSLKGMNESKSQLQLKLALLKKTQLIELFKDLFDKKTVNYTIDNGSFIINEKRLELIFTFEPLSAQQIIDVKNKFESDDFKLVIVGSIFTDSAIMLAKQCSISLIGIEQVFNFIKETNSQLISENVIKKSKKRFSNFFSSNHARKYIFYGIVLDVMGIVSFYPLYYFLFGTFFIISGLVSLFFGHKEQTECLTFESIFNKLDKN